jgi:mannose-6-phosphate isomerase class I
MVAQKGRPSLRRLGTSWRSPHPTQYSSLRNIESKHFQLTVNARRTPSGVLGNHSKDEFPQLLADAFPARAGSMP